MDFQRKTIPTQTGFDDNHSAWKLRTLLVAQDTDLQAFIKSGKPKEHLSLIQHHVMWVYAEWRHP